MNILQAYRMAIRSIRGNKTRSLLTMLGVIIGVSSVIVAVAFAQGSTKSITDSIQGLGTNLIQVSITVRNSNRNVTLNDLNKFMAKNTDSIAAIAPQLTGSVTVKAGSQSRSTSLIGTSSDYETIRNVHVQKGRFLLPFDQDQKTKVALIGTAVADDLFKGQEPIGQKIKIDGQVFRIVGLLQERDGGQAQSDDDQVIIPINAAQRLLSSAVIRNFSIQATSAEKVDQVMSELTTFLKTIYKNNDNNRAFRVFNQAQMLTTLSSVTGAMSAVLGGIAAISLVVGGIGIMNIMLVSVTERTREIGIRKAIGARKKSILAQFLIEAVVITGIGGFLGVTIGLLIIKFVIGGLKIVPVVYSIPWITVSFSISLIIGIIFGMFPAYKAANLNPIEALRYE